jgi:hypothetical protein
MSGAMRDPGRFAVVLVSPALALFLSRGEPPAERTTAAELRADARTRPEDLGAVVVASGMRAAAWFYLTFAAILLVALGRIISGSGPAILHGPAQALVDLSVYLAMFTLGAMITALTHLFIAAAVGHRAFPERASRAPQVMLSGDSYGGLVRWAATPSWLDTVFAVWFAVEIGGLILA